ncbi:MAG TPA: hypothetical protein VFV01_47230 [Spirillospora sp.]|nr:hypothetical protein [Spirillospora sp.]
MPGGERDVVGRDDPRKVRVVLIEASASPVLRARRRVSRRHYAELVADYARTFWDVPPEADAQLHFTATMLVAGWNENIIAWLEGDLRASASDLADMFADAAEALAAPYASVRRRSGATRP